MLCPNCKDTKLVMADRQGIEIDYCPDCRGVWLDRGELDKIIERSVGQTNNQGFGHSSSTASPVPNRQPEPVRHTESHHYKKDDHHQYGQQQGYKKKKEGFWGEIFDFD
ncbi:zf-TFIIB domain-containing protein [Leeia sp. TBRC 13508]|uniref:Zf-TFIIB domain-containing protein n=1 Tax=Leeia speluncae TaxID=2884804 RepID=A0ABS8D2S2_9NEIS|nr:zf-TFIIB domain-containing protein [Leeia speluncae]MCB6182498.1 zf-TFIIB domain-containing protein [Leeia speluncae]